MTTLRLSLVLCVVSACAPPVPSSVESGFDMQKHSLSMQNFSQGTPTAKLNTSLMRRMFGDEVCSAGTTECALTPIASAWMQKANQSMSGGRCEGFAVLSNLLFTGDVTASSLGGSDGRALSLQNKPVARELAYWFSTQLIPQVSSEHTERFMAKDVMPFLAKALDPKGTERYRLGIVKMVNGRPVGGHALTPIAYYATKTAGQYVLRVYDSNNPDSERELTIDTAANRWSFEAARNPSEASSLFFGDATNNNPLYFTPVRTRLGTLPCPFCADSKVTIQTNGGLEVTADNGTSSAGVKDGQPVVSGSGSVAPILSGLEDDPAAYLLTLEGSGDTVFNLAQPGDGSGEISVFGPKFTALIQATFITPGTVDQASMTSNGAGVVYQNNSRTPVTVSTTVQTPTGTVSVTANVAGGSTQVQTSVNPTSGQIDVKASGSGVGVEVAVAKTNMDGTTQTGAVAFSTGSGSGGAQIPTSSWQPGAPLTGMVDNSGGAQPFTQANCFNNVKDGPEADVDCGGGCPRLCFIGQRCSARTDCTSGFCRQGEGRCVASACEDGAKSPESAESDVDCGGSCGRCELGRACASDRDCRVGACRGNTCVLSSVVELRVSGIANPGDALVVTLSNGETLAVGRDGVYPFVTRFAEAFSASITKQPSSAFCTLNGTNFVGTGALISIQAQCQPTRRVGGSVVGLLPTDSLTLANNGMDLTPVRGQGTFWFPTAMPIAAGGYSVTIAVPPTEAECTILNPTGGWAPFDVGSVLVDCIAFQRIPVEVSGLPIGMSVTLTNSGADPLTITADMSTTFTRLVGQYDVQVSVQPSAATCTVTNGIGVVGRTPVPPIQVSCSRNPYSIGGALSGLPLGNSVTLTNNGADPTVRSSNGAFSFATPTSAYAVAVSVQPADGTCTVTRGSGIAGAPVTDVQVACVQTKYDIGGVISGLPATNSIVLTNNGGDALTRSANGSFGFSQRSATYSVQIATQPANATCVVVGGSGNANGPVTSVQINCTPTPYSIGGTLSGLPASTTVTLINNGGNALPLSANGPFSFSQTSSAYLVTVQTQPAGASCAITNGTGTALGPVTSIQVTCSPGAFTIGGTLSGLPATASVTLTNNGGDPLVLNADGPFTFSQPALGYLVAIQTQPFNGTCAVSAGSGTASATVTSIAVTCRRSGSLDTSFGTNGWLSYAPTSFHNEWHDFALNPDDSMVLAGRNQTAGAEQDWDITKVTASGAVDTSFATNGTFTVNRGSNVNEAARAIRRASDGAFYVAGTVFEASTLDFAVIHLDSTGVLDTSYGTTGLARANAGGHEYAWDMALYPDGRTLVVGSFDVGTSADVLVARFTQGGGLDTSFGASGFTRFGMAGVEEYATSVAIDSNSKIWLVGLSGNDTLVARLRDDGQLDTTFGNNGIQQLDFSAGSRFDIARRVALDVNENILIGGFFSNASGNDDLYLARMFPSGNIDTSGFGTMGTARYDRNGGADRIYAIRPLPDGRTLVAGLSQPGLVTLRFDTNGVLDPTWGAGGVAIPAVGNGNANQVDVDSQGRVVVGGNIGPVNPDFGVCRLTP